MSGRTFRINVAGYESRIFGQWRRAEDGVSSFAFNAAAAAARAGEGFALAIARLCADPNLSAVGKIEPARMHIRDRQREIAELAAKVEAARTDVAARRAARMQIPKADAADATIDVAAANWLRSLTVRERFEAVLGMKLGTASQRLTEAVARMPAELLGITREQHSAILSEHIRRADPAAAESLDEEAGALDDAMEVIADAAQFIAAGGPYARHGRPAIPGIVEVEPVSTVAALRAAGAAENDAEAVA